jgi:drug/metabolite transporter (DMT)-like permease
MLAVVLLWGSTYSGLKAMQAVIPPLGLTGLRAAVSALALLGVSFLLGVRGPRPTRTDLRDLVVLGLTGGTLFQLCLVGGIALTTPSHSALITALSPVLAALFAWLRLGERLGPLRSLGILLAFGGVALIVTQGGALGGGQLLGDLVSLGAAVAWAVYSVVGKPILARRPALEVSAHTLLIGAVPLLPLGLPDLLAVRWSAIAAEMWLLLAYLSFGALAGGYTLWYWALARAATARVAVFSYLIPVVAVLMSVAVGQEPLTGALAAGTLLVIGGVVIAQLGR